jgi:PAS domain S-box-containing protein
VRLKAYLLFLTLATLLPVAIFASIVGYFLVQEQRETFRRGAEARTLAMSTALDTELNGSIATLQALATLPALDEGDFATFRDRAERILATQPDWSNINVALPSGQQVMNLQRAPGAPLPDIAKFDPNWKLAVERRAPFISDLVVGPITGQWDYAVRVPVIRNDSVRYVLSAVVKPESMSKLLKAQDVPPDWVAVVLDGSDRIVARTVNPEGSVGQLASQSLREALARAPSGWFSGSTIEGTAVYTPYRRSQTSGWAFAMGIPASALDGAAWRAAGLLALALLGALVLAFGLAQVVGRRVSAPIASLASATDAIGRGQRVPVPQTAAIAEVARLARTLQESMGAMREREERLQLALDAGRMGSWEWNVRTSAVTWSPELEAIHGLAPGSFPGTFQAYQKDIHSEDLEKVQRAIAHSVEHGPEHHVEYRIVRPDGAVRWVEGRGKVFRDERGAPARVVGVCTDITERKQAEEELRQAEERMRSVVDHVVDGIITIDERSAVQTFNPAAERIFGYAASEMIGQNVKVLMPDPYRREHDSYVANYVRTGQAKIIGTGREVEGRRKDGATFPLDLAVSVFHIGSRRYFTGVVRDITERKRAEDRLRRERERLALALGAGQMGAYELNIVENVLWWSPETYALFGVAPEHFVPTPEAFIAFVHPEDRELFGRRLEESIAQRQSFMHEFRTLRPDGTLRWIAVRAQTEYDATGRPVRRFGVALDITERKRIEEALRHADRAKDEFLAMLSHELRNPLAALTAASHVLSVVEPSRDEAIKARAIVERQTKHMARLIADLLDVSRVTLGKLALQRARFNVADAVSSVVDVWRASGRLDTHKVLLAAEPAWVDGDRARIEQVVANLLDNALKFTPAGAAVTVSVRREGAEAVLRVADQGIGLAAEECERVFDLFVQAERTERAGGGLGIGLALVKRLAELHGGSVSVSSEGRGRGAVFMVRLPAVEQPAARDDALSMRVDGARSILIVEDNDDARQMLQTVLALRGHEVRAARDGETGLALAAVAPPDVALIDVALPDMDGYEVARRLRAAPGARRIGLVAVTGFGQAEDQRRALEAGFDAHLVKPVTPERLEQVIAGLR